MGEKAVYNECYEIISKEILNDRNIPDENSRLIRFMSEYKKIIQAEDSLLEWQFDLWQSKIRGIFISIFVMLALFCFYTVCVSDSYILNEIGTILGAIIGLSLLVTAVIFCQPIRHQHKMTETGIYVSLHRRGMSLRKNVFKGLVLFVCLSVLVLLFFSGTAALMSALSGAMALIGLNTLLKREHSKEYALPWESIHVFSIDKEKETVEIQHHFTMYCDNQIFQEVQKLLGEKRVASSMLIHHADQLSSTEYQSLKAAAQFDLPFLWVALPKNQNGLDF
ncbi:hypothetical protein [Photobacterium sp. 1_MG-2023]|uniref:hypothetical protein n=1 Tax=Photobacterium sp. 1_MG-2023 TaxID=3062646 RepID=UPI0026E26060|nr:hypothetical protein [Photobacterium sp. 1_MG-2023]MDO6706919.1 hypothetical protein [Photobacterium sp. 1_MG-2023]